MLAEAEKAARNPSLAAYKAMEQWKQWSASRPWDDDHELVRSLCLADSSMTLADHPALRSPLKTYGD
jgi:hypothetical protein